MAPGECAHLGHQRSDLVFGHDVDLPAADADIAGDDPEAMRVQEMAGKQLTEVACRQPS